MHNPFKRIAQFGQAALNQKNKVTHKLVTAQRARSTRTNYALAFILATSFCAAGMGIFVMPFIKWTTEGYAEYGGGNTQTMDRAAKDRAEYYRRWEKNPTPGLRLSAITAGNLQDSKTGNSLRALVA